MRIEAESTIVGEYFNIIWQAGLAQAFGISVNTTVRILWVVDNPVSSYRFQDIPCQLIEQPQIEHPHTIGDYPIIINWNWFSPDNSALSKIRMDYHANEDILYIVNQEHRRHSLTVYDVLMPPTAD